MRDKTPHAELRVLIYAPTPHAVGLTEPLLSGAGVSYSLCRDLPELGRELARGAAALMLAEETLGPTTVQMLTETLQDQPPWSDLAVLVLTTGDRVLSPATVALELVGNVMLLERPISTTTLTSAIRSVLRGRVRQYEMRAHLAEREAAAQALQESEERLRHALTAAEMGTWRIELQTNRQTRDESFNRILGLEAVESTQPLEDFLSRIHPDDQPAVRTQLAQALHDGTSYHAEFRILRTDGSMRWLRDRGVVLIEHGRSVGMTGTAVDISELKFAEEQLKALNETLEQRVAERTAIAEQQARQLRRLAAELTQAEQQERRRLAKILHDHLQQLLVAARLSVGLARTRAKDDALREALMQVDELLNQSVDASRSLTVSLSPPILYDGGFGPALDWLARWMEEKHGLHVDVEVLTNAEPDREETLVFLFESVRELLFNVVKHAGVCTALVRVTETGDDQVCVTVQDAGVGLDLDALEAESRSAGFGLFSIRERLEILGGRFEITSAPNLGVTVRLFAPVRPPAIPRNAEPDESLAGDEEPAGPGVALGDRIRVLLVDDHRILRMGMVGMLQGEKDIEIVGEASDGLMALEMAREKRPDVIVMDITMPRMSGIEATRRIMAEMPHVHIIGMSMHEQEGMTQAMLEAGAVDYLTKGGPPEELCRAIRNACCHA